MSVYLHHYPASPYSEKVRLLLGYLGVPWRSVVIPSVMPRPLLMPLTGGYRKTPVLQIDANVYCDSRIIARGLARHCGNRELYAHGFTAQRVADWADTHLFQVAVALNFAPDALGAMMSHFTSEEIQRFRQDRAELAKGAVINTLSPGAAGAYLRYHLHELNQSVTDDYLFGRSPCIADFSVYHGLWFISNNSVNARLLDDYANVETWMDRMAALGHGQVEDSGGEEALAAAKAASPELPALDNMLPDGFELGQEVDVTPVDYGLVPVRGRLAAWAPDEVVIERESAESGPVMVHFPSPGFEVRPA